jgi:uncharacterized protein (TIGR00251 family)
LIEVRQCNARLYANPRNLETAAMPVQLLRIRVKPNARVASLVQGEDGGWLAQVKAPPVDGKANKELTGLVAKHFSRAKSAVSIRSGAGGRIKLVEVDTG